MTDAGNSLGAVPIINLLGAFSFLGSCGSSTSTNSGRPFDSYHLGLRAQKLPLLDTMQLGANALCVGEG